MVTKPQPTNTDVLKAVAGDQEAAERVVEALRAVGRRQIISYSRHYGRDEAEARFLAGAWAALLRWSPEGGTPWTTWACYGGARALQVRTRADAPIPASPYEKGGRAASLNAPLGGAGLRLTETEAVAAPEADLRLSADMKAALAALTDEQRDMALSRLRGESVAAAARRLGIPTHKAHRLWAAARAVLRRELHAYAA